MRNITAHTLYKLCMVVNQPGNPVPYGWSTVWTNISTTGANPEDNFAAVFQSSSEVVLVREPVLASVPVYVLAIQDAKDLREIWQEFAVGRQVRFDPIKGAHISQGSHRALMHVRRLKDVGSGTTLESFLQALPEGANLIVTGFGLGGNIASVMAPWIAANLPQFASTETGFPVNLGAVTFAAPSAGDSAFASFLNAQKNYAAHFNSNDVIPNLWAALGPLCMRNIRGLFPAPGPTGVPLLFKLMLDEYESVFEKNEILYTQTNGTLFAFPSKAPPDPNKSFEDQWVLEMAYQHHEAYEAQFGEFAPPADTTG